MFESDEKDSMSPLLVLGLGILVGAAFAMLIAPKSGPDTRSLLREKTEELKDLATGAVGETRDRAGKVIEDLSQNTRERVNELVQRGEKAVDEVQNAHKHA